MSQSVRVTSENSQSPEYTIIFKIEWPRIVQHGLTLFDGSVVILEKCGNRDFVWASQDSFRP